MCQYFFKCASFTIDKEKFIRSVENNPHGWGLLWRPHPSSGKRWPWYYEECDDPNTDNDPEELYKLINEKHKDHQVVVHFRWVTAGERSKENIHPFLVYRSRRHELWLVHNGTIFSLKTENSKKSDTRIFVENYLSKVAASLKDPFKWECWEPLVPFIEDFIGTKSRIMLVSSKERFPIFFNEDIHHFNFIDNSKSIWSWTASNTYSFTKDYRKPSTNTVTNNYYPYSGYYNYHNHEEYGRIHYVNVPIDDLQDKKRKLYQSAIKKGWTNLWWTSTGEYYILKGTRPSVDNVIDIKEEEENKKGSKSESTSVDKENKDMEILKQYFSKSVIDYLELKSISDVIDLADDPDKLYEELFYMYDSYLYEFIQGLLKMLKSYALSAEIKEAFNV